MTTWTSIPCRSQSIMPLAAREGTEAGRARPTCASPAVGAGSRRERIWSSEPDLRREASQSQLGKSVTSSPLAAGLRAPIGPRAAAVEGFVPAIVRSLPVSTLRYVLIFVALPSFACYGRGAGLFFLAANTAIVTAAIVSASAPPPPRDSRPEPRRGYAWQPGYWDTRGRGVGLGRRGWAALRGRATRGRRRTGARRRWNLAIGAGPLGARCAPARAATPATDHAATASGAVAARRDRH